MQVLFYLDSCRKGGLVHYAPVMMVTSESLGLVPGLGIDYHHRLSSAWTQQDESSCTFWISLGITQ